MDLSCFRILTDSQITTCANVLGKTLESKGLIYSSVGGNLLPESQIVILYNLSFRGFERWL